ncbi:hypothetical protein HGRIS_003714 [Hohenbuehelia grisea]|uniref:Uncharacterized protein n=1 Tax=Hohenbuehelia grisea TaxID=104357 RepID=A0ABR3JH67_9AGAR
MTAFRRSLFPTAQGGRRVTYCRHHLWPPVKPLSVEALESPAHFLAAGFSYGKATDSLGVGHVQWPAHISIGYHTARRGKCSPLSVKWARQGESSWYFVAV